MLTGQRIGAYEIQGLLGAGGMGEVYRARDTKLGRDVAIKLLPAGFTSDPDRVARFEREARVLASLNHPNIATIYGVEDGAIVMELVEGRSLAEFVASGFASRQGSRDSRKRVSDALAVARQIADALDAAHERGVVHRDLKPANIRITPDGTVKVLDFGLAKASGASGTEDLTVAATREGIIVGTAAYMSPEQARGLAVDQRTDVWAFGCVLYEMLTGQQAFGGATLSDVLAAVIEREPDWTTLPAHTPPPVWRLLRRCLDKDLKQRLHHIADARLEIDDAVNERTPSSAPPAALQPRLRWRRAVVLVAASIAATIGVERLATQRPPSTAERPLTRLVQATADGGITATPALSNDGALLAYASDRAGMDNLDIWVQQSAGTPLRVTDDPADEGEPAFSPDGSRLAYRSERDGGGIYLTATLGGQEPRLFVADGRRPRFSPDGRSITYWTGTDIGFAESVGSYRTFVVRADGGSAQEISGFTGARYPVWAPDGRSLLVLGSRDERPAAASYDWWRVPLDGSAPVRVGMVDTMRRAGVIFEGEDVGTIGPDAWENNRVLFSDGSHLWSLQLDPRSGTAVSAQRLTFGTGRDLHPATGKMDRLAFTSAMVTNAVWALPIDADRGVVTGAPQPVTGFTGYAARPSATVRSDLVAYRSLLPRPSILIKNLRTKGIFDTGVAGSAFGPALAPDGTSVAYEADGGVSVVSVRGGSARVLCRPCSIGAWSADGRRLVIVGAETNAGRLTSIDAGTGASQDLIVRPQTAVNRPFVSPDGRLLVFRVTVAQRDAIMIAPIATQVPAAEESWIEMVAPETDARPAGWSPDGGIVYFVSGRDGTRCLYAQRVNRTTGALVGAPFDVRHFHRARNVLRDSSGFVLSTGPATAVTNGFFFYDLGGFSSNIWTIETR